jgi:hypothetical protein
MRKYLTCNCSLILHSFSNLCVYFLQWCCHHCHCHCRHHHNSTKCALNTSQSTRWVKYNFPLPSCSKLYVNHPAYTTPCKCHCVFIVSSSFVQTSNHCHGKRAPDTGELITSALLTATLLHEMQTMQAVHEPKNQTPFYGVRDRANLLTNDWQTVVLCMTSYIIYL